MYVTRPLSMLKHSQSALSLPPPEGPNSGFLVIYDEEMPTTCFGLCKDYFLKGLPFPQNKNLSTCYNASSVNGASSLCDRVVLIPVLNQPLSSNLYYAIQPRGKHKGEAFTSSKQEDMATCCFCKVVSDKKPQPFDPDDIYQQIEICCRKWGGFFAKSVAPDGFPPYFLRRKGWEMIAEDPDNFQLGDAPGLDTTLRARLPDFNFPLSNKTSKSVVVGKWYCPFIFIKEGTLEQQIDSSVYYEMTLEQRWEQIFACENGHEGGNVVDVDVFVQTEVVSFNGIESVPDETNVVDGFMWFKSSTNGGGEPNVGLSKLIIERMKWEEERFGWVEGNKRQVSVKTAEELGGVGNGRWRKFGCYMLVERFVLKRMNGSVVLTYDFKHTNQIRSKWE